MAYQRKKRAYEQEPQQVPQVQNNLFASPDVETEDANNPYVAPGPTAAPNWEAVQRQIDNPVFDFGKISILPPDSALQRQPVAPSTLSKRERFIQRVFNVQREPVVSSMSRPPGPLGHHFAAPQREDGQAAPLAPTLAIQRQAKTADQGTGAIAQSGAVNLMPQGSGRPLPKQVTDPFVQSGYPEVKQARVHVDDAATQSIQAKAYTQNNNIVVQSSGANDPKLLGHEATHVVQQSQMALKPDVNGTPINANPTLEQNADDNGERVARNEPVKVAGGSMQQPPFGQSKLVQASPNVVMPESSQQSETSGGIIQRKPIVRKDKNKPTTSFNSWEKVFAYLCSPKRGSSRLEASNDLKQWLKKFMGDMEDKDVYSLDEVYRKALEEDPSIRRVRTSLQKQQSSAYLDKMKKKKAEKYRKSVLKAAGLSSENDAQIPNNPVNNNLLQNINLVGGIVNNNNNPLQDMIANNNVDANDNQVLNDNNGNGANLNNVAVGDNQQALANQNNVENQYEAEEKLAELKNSKAKPIKNNNLNKKLIGLANIPIVTGIDEKENEVSSLNVNEETGPMRKFAQQLAELKGTNEKDIKALEGVLRQILYLEGTMGGGNKKALGVAENGDRQQVLKAVATTCDINAQVMMYGAIGIKEVEAIKAAYEKLYKKRLKNPPDYMTYGNDDEKQEEADTAVETKSGVAHLFLIGEGPKFKALWNEWQKRGGWGVMKVKFNHEGAGPHTFVIERISKGVVSIYQAYEGKYTLKQSLVGMKQESNDKTPKKVPKSGSAMKAAEVGGNQIDLLVRGLGSPADVKAFREGNSLGKITNEQYKKAFGSTLNEKVWKVGYGEAISSIAVFTCDGEKYRKGRIKPNDFKQGKSSISHYEDIVAEGNYQASLELLRSARSKAQSKASMEEMTKAQTEEIKTGSRKNLFASLRTFSSTQSLNNVPQSEKEYRFNRTSSALGNNNNNNNNSSDKDKDKDKDK
ncbi:MAG: DUF4157 domain-containing protein [Cyanobacteria bacterium P01_A01_bin.123]